MSNKALVVELSRLVKTYESGDKDQTVKRLHERLKGAEKRGDWRERQMIELALRHCR